MKKILPFLFITLFFSCNQENELEVAPSAEVEKLGFVVEEMTDNQITYSYKYGDLQNFKFNDGEIINIGNQDFMVSFNFQASANNKRAL
ncbi:MAG: hypothetical protein AAF363_01870 [Bacteroidota bacterium]